MTLLTALRPAAVVACSAFVFGAIAATPVCADLPAICYVASGGGVSLIIGSGFDATARVVVWSPPPTAEDSTESADEIVNGSPALPLTPPPGARTLTPLSEVNDQVLYADLPHQPVVLWVTTQAGSTLPRLVNTPDVWLVSDDEPAPGDKLRLIGRNFIWGNSMPNGTGAMNPPQTVLFRSRQSGKDRVAETAKLSDEKWVHTDEHVIGVLVPAGLPPGSYDVFVHSGYGGSLGWSAPFPLNVAIRRTLADAFSRPEQQTPGVAPRVVRVQGAAADGLHDDTPYIQKALDRASAAGGGIVYLPAGQYAIDRTLHLKPGVFLAGAGRDATSVVVSPFFPMSGGLPQVTLTPSLAWQRGYADDWKPSMKDMTPMVWIESKSGIEDLSLVGGPGAKCAVFVATPDWHTISKDVSLIRMNITSAEPTFEVGGYQSSNFGIAVATATRDFTVSQCRVTCGEPLYMYPARPEHYGTRISQSTFEVVPRHSTGNLIMDSITHSLIEDNDFVGGARSIESQRGSNYNWIFNNRVSDDGGWANADEIMMSEYGIPYWDGPCTAATANTIESQGAAWTVNQFVECSDPIFVFVKQGKGFGQIRTVISNTADSLTVDSPWDITPDSTTRFTVLPMTYRNLYVNDQVLDSDGACQFGYGSIADCVVAGIDTHLSGQLNATSLYWPDQPDYVGGVVAFNEFYANRLIGGSAGIRLADVGFHKSHNQITGQDATVGRPGNVIGNTIRDNEVMYFRDYPLNQYWPVWRNMNSTEEGGIDLSGGSYNLIDDNYITNGSVGVRVDGGTGNVVIDNRIEDVLTPLRDLGQKTFIGVAGH